MFEPIPRIAYVALGSNVDPQRHVPLALATLRRLWPDLEVAPMFVTASLGPDNQPDGKPDFWNTVLRFTTAWNPTTVRAALRRIEHLVGRRRDGERYAPRSLDLDLLLLGDLIDSGLPHRDLQRYPFVRWPLALLDPERQPPYAMVPIRTQSLRLGDPLHLPEPLAL
ncbi:MAG: 2-amino-4-hydroxy-6-hydroxymethyldihydropteridine diphosphokinase [Proteobacteria bacterium CG1_02_64_396]|nr:MAG: 2-amino-4-hydroxy-6-hydroxymethyldihydropteridine diphosphokinase [Proteobacteria bacterium CG1_02_64_396]